MKDKKFNGLDPFKQIIKDQKLSKNRLGEMWCELSRFEIPKEFSSEILVHSFHNSTKGSLAMKDIESIVGKRWCLYEWRKQAEERERELKE